MSNESSFNNQDEIIAYLEKILEKFDIYAISIFLIPGLILNLLTIIVFSRPKFWKRTTMGYYYTVSTVLSTCAVIVGLFDTFPAVFDYDLQMQNNLLCKTIWIAQTQVIYASGYFRILITLDLMLNTLYPMKFRFFSKVSNLIKLTALIIVTVAVSNAVQYWRHLKHTLVIDQENNITETIVDCTLPEELTDIHDFEALLSRIIPSVSNLTMNLLIIRVLLRSKKNFSSKNGKLGKDGRSAKENTFAYSLVAQNFIFFAVTLPHVILSLAQIIYNHTEDEDIVEVLYEFGVWSSFIFESIPFYINLAFNRLFRNELFMLLRPKNMTSPLGPLSSSNGTGTRGNTAKTAHTVNTANTANHDNSVFIQN